MTKAEFLTKVQSKPGFVSIITDTLAQDHIPGDPIEKRYLYINHTNADGTMGKTYVEYLLNTTDGTASFYNMEREALDVTEPSTDQKKLNALQNYLGAKYVAYFVTRFDTTHNWAEADVFSINVDKLVKKTVIVYKKGASPIADIEVVTA